MINLNDKLKNKLYKHNNLHNNEIEYLLNPENNRLTIYPIKNNIIWKAYKKQQAAFWTAEEIDFSKDYNDYLKLSENEQYFIKMILAFFSSSDTIVNINLSERFINDVKIREVLVAYTWQMMMENIHCVSGDTKILTDKGYFSIENLEGENINVWNGKEFSPTIVKYTNISLLYKIELSNGMSLKCTPKHKWYINIDNQKRTVFTKDLTINHEIYNYDFPTHNNIDSASDDSASPTDNNNDSESNDSLESNNTYDLDLDKYKLEDLINCNSLNLKIKWLNNIILNNSNYNIESQTLEFFDFNLINLQLLLTTMNIKSNIILDYTKLIINTHNLYKLIKLGLKLNKNIIFPEKLIIDDKITVINIQILTGIYDTYCFNEPNEHSGIFNGILTGQSETYSLQIDNIVRDTIEKEKLFNAIKEFPCIAEKVNWAVRWIESNDNFAIRLIAFAIVEGVFFSGSFCAIFWLKKRNIMPGLCTSNELIARDEGLHCDMAISLYKMLENKLDEDIIHNIFKDAVEIESKFICESLPCSLLGMNSNLMIDYIKFVADRLLVDLGYNKIYNTINPFDFMESISVEGKTNFFEARPTQYQKASVLNKSRDNIFDFNENF